MRYFVRGNDISLSLPLQILKRGEDGRAVVADYVPSGNMRLWLVKFTEHNKRMPLVGALGDGMVSFGMEPTIMPAGGCRHGFTAKQMERREVIGFSIKGSTVYVILRGLDCGRYGIEVTDIDAGGLERRCTLREAFRVVETTEETMTEDDGQLLASAVFDEQETWLAARVEKLLNRVAELEDKTSTIRNMRVKVVNELPTVVDSEADADEANNIYYRPTNIIFLIPHTHDNETNLAADKQSSTGKAEDAYDEYIWVEETGRDSHWEKLGNADSTMDINTATDNDINSIF